MGLPFFFSPDLFFSTLPFYFQPSDLFFSTLLFSTLILFNSAPTLSISALGNSN
jgi:hypothetical protein